MGKAEWKDHWTSQKCKILHIRERITIRISICALFFSSPYCIITGVQRIKTVFLHESNSVGVISKLFIYGATEHLVVVG